MFFFILLHNRGYFLFSELTNHISKNNMVLTQLDIILIAHELGSLKRLQLRKGAGAARGTDAGN
jgi:hypothetical protein